MSPAPIYLPQKQNPWELLLPQMASMIMGQSIQHRFAKELLAEKIKAETQARLTEDAGKREWWKEQESTRQAGAERLKGIPQAKEPIDLRVELVKSAQAQGGKPIQTIMTPGGLIPFVDGRPVDRGVTRERIVDIAGKKVLMPRPMEGQAWTTKDGKVVQDKLPKTLAEIGAESEERARGRERGTKKPAQGYLLPDGTTVRSFDGGRTYLGEDGKSHPLPYNATKTNVQLSGAELSMFAAKKQAQAVASEMPPITRGKSMEKVAESGTGPYSMLAASTDALLGGFLGIDKIFGKKGLFSETQENRQVLRNIKQVGKSALMNSSRGAIWEQERIDKLFPDPDKLFANPRTESKKFQVLRDTLLIEKEFNNEAILTATTPKEVGALRSSNRDIDRLLKLIGTGTPTITSDTEFTALPSGTVFIDPEGVRRTKP